jgi:hypothetical protein
MLLGALVVFSGFLHIPMFWGVFCVCFLFLMVLWFELRASHLLSRGCAT